MEETTLEVSCQDVRSKLEARQAFLLLDCREPHEHELVSLPGSTLLPMSELMARVDELIAHKSDDVVVYCHHGMRSAQVAAWLRSQGFAGATSMAGGIDQWAVEIDPTLPRY